MSKKDDRQFERMCGLPDPGPSIIQVALKKMNQNQGKLQDMEKPKEPEKPADPKVVRRTLSMVKREMEDTNRIWENLCNVPSLGPCNVPSLGPQAQQESKELAPEKKESKEKKKTFRAKYNQVCKKFEEFKKSIQNPKYEAKAVPYNPYILFEKPRIKSQRVKETFTKYAKPKFRFVDLLSSSSQETDSEDSDSDSKKPKKKIKKEDQ
jgi:hypothetical protein